MYHPPRILVVEDDAALRFVISEVLRDGHLEVVEAPDAQFALNYLETVDRIDLVFTDVNMPGAFDGAALANAVNENFPSIKVIVTSGQPPPTPLMSRFIAKPYGVYNVLDIIKATL